MAAQIKVLIDLNVVLDALQKRHPFFGDSASVLAMAEKGVIQGFIAAHSWTTLFYLYRKDKGADRARVQVTELLQFLSVAAVDQRVVEQALNLSYRDYEDAVQMMAAVNCGADYLVTRNVADFKAGPLAVLRPAELLGILPK